MSEQSYQSGELQRIRVDFYGTYCHSLDAKGRIVIPARYREVIKDDSLIIVRGNIMEHIDAQRGVTEPLTSMKHMPPHLRVYQEKTYSKILRDEKISRRSANKAIRSTELVSMGEQGKLTIPAESGKKEYLKAHSKFVGEYFTQDYMRHEPLARLLQFEFQNRNSSKDSSEVDIMITSSGDGIILMDALYWTAWEFQEAFLQHTDTYGIVEEADLDFEEFLTDHPKMHEMISKLEKLVNEGTEQ